MTGVAPDYAEPVVGWRLWNTSDSGGTPCLTSVYFPVVWPVHEPLEAVCVRPQVRFPFRRSKNRPHASPAERCQCGIYALAGERFGETLQEFVHRASYLVLGTVSLWGTVHEHEHGWRAARGYPERLIVWQRVEHCPEADRVARGIEQYGVPVEKVVSIDVPDAVSASRPPIPF